MTSNEFSATDYVIKKWVDGAWVKTQPRDLRADDIIRAAHFVTGELKVIKYKDLTSTTSVLILVVDPEYLKHNMDQGFNSGPFFKLTIMGYLKQTQERTMEEQK